jgi:vacuolar-type H+-ATPase subunit H
MKELIGRILSEEEAAAKKVADAERKAQETVRDAEKNAGRILAEAAAATKQMAQKELERSRTSLLAGKEARLREIRAAQETLRKEKEAAVPSLAERVFRRIVTIGE